MNSPQLPPRVPRARKRRQVLVRMEVLGELLGPLNTVRGMMALESDERCALDQAIGCIHRAKRALEAKVTQ